MGFNKLHLPDLDYLKESLKAKGNDEFIDFWDRRPINYKINQNLFKEYLKTKNPFNLFKIKLPNKQKNSINPLIDFFKFNLSVINYLSGYNLSQLKNFIKYFDTCFSSPFFKLTETSSLNTLFKMILKIKMLKAK